jgi:cytochrome c peroxidase
MYFIFKIGCLAILWQLVLISCSSSPKVENINTEREKIELGKKLFFDKRLSIDNTISCASCHIPEKAFADGQQFGTGVRNQKTDRNVPTILNSKFLKKVMFDGDMANLERQVLVPITEHKEMGSDIKLLMEELSKDKSYQAASKRAFRRKFDAYVLTRSIAAYERSLVAMNSRYDKYISGDKKALTANEVAGMKIFNSLYCAKCHAAPHFTNFVTEDNGLYAVYEDPGRYRVSHDSSDIGKFKVPSLRNVGLTAPYMHDGSLKTLEEVVRHYMAGGKGHFNQSAVIEPFELTEEEQRNLVLFLKSLSDKGQF